MNFPLINRDIPAVVRAAQLVGVTGSGVLAGASIMLSVWVIPTLMEAPAPVAAKQWKKMFDLGRVSMPPTTILTSSIFGYLAWQSATPSSFRLYTAAAIIAPTMIPFTIGVMMPTNNKLEEKAQSFASSGADEVGVAKEETVNALLDRWATLNLVRSVLLLTSAILGGWASLQPTEVLGLEKVEILMGADRMG